MWGIAIPTTYKDWVGRRFAEIQYGRAELSHRQDNTNHGLCYTSRGAMAVTNGVVCSVLFGNIKH